MKNIIQPKTLQEAIIYFSDIDNCLKSLIAVRWPNGVICPTCNSKQVSFISKRRVWECKNIHPKRQFSVKVGTLMEDSPIGLDKWMAAIWMICNDKNGISSYEVHRGLGITQKSAWFLNHRIRKAMQDGGGLFNKFSGDVEVDETFIGGKARNMHMDVKKRRIHGSGPTDKTAVMGILERGDSGKPKDREKHSKVVTVVVPNRKKKTLQAEVKANVQAGAALYSDALLSYDGLESDYAHQVVDHAVEYVRGKVHTNGLENFWSLTDRMIGGTYVSIEPFHTFRYLDEMSFRFNHRGTRKIPVTDYDRFQLAISHLTGKRLTYDELTGKGMQKPHQDIPF
jgi:transposase-like protein